MPVTRHAYKRAHQRLGFSRSALDRMAGIALEKGECSFDSDAIRVTYGQHTYLFKDDILITVY